MTLRFLDWREEHTWEGKFWLPTTPDQRVPGRLKFKGGTFPVLSTMSPLLPSDLERPSHLLGSVKGVDVSLLGCALMVRDSPWMEKEFSSQVIGFDGLLIGRHAEPTLFARRLRLRFTNTYRLTAGGIWEFADPKGPASKPEHLTVHVRTEDEVATVVHDGLRIVIRVYAPVNESHGAHGDELTVKPQVDVHVEFPNLVALSEARQLWDDLELFWSLMTGNQSDLIVALVSEDPASTDDAGFEGVSTPFIGVVHADAGDEQCFGDYLYDLTRGSHPGQLANVLHRWLQRRTLLRLSARLLIDTWNKNVSWESKLGIIAQAVEAFHRTSTHQQTFIVPASYEPVEMGLGMRITELTTDPDLRTSLKKRVEFGNQVSLRRRTKDLMRAMPPGLRDAFGKKWQLLADEMVEARNAIIHRDPNAAAPDFRETVRIAGHFLMTVHVALSQALAVPDDVIVQRLQAQRPYQDWLSYRR